MKAVVFDMDGVLFDTERLCLESWEEIAKIYGLDGMREFFPSCIGRNKEDDRILFLERYGADADYEGFRREASKWFHEAIDKRGIPTKSGVKEILTYLKEAGFLIGLASSSSRSSVLSNLEKAQITDYFQTIVSGDMVQHSKPEPDIYLIACRELGIEPGETYAIEDSYNGIRSAYRAGMVPIMVPDMLPPDEEMAQKSRVICKDLTETKAYIAKEKEHG